MRPPSKKTPRQRAARLLDSYRNSDRKKKMETWRGGVDVFYARLNPRREPCCSYCGTTEQLGLDRIDNSAGHTNENTILACGRCNVMRGNSFTVEEMKVIGRAIACVDNRDFSYFYGGGVAKWTDAVCLTFNVDIIREELEKIEKGLLPLDEFDARQIRTVRHHLRRTLTELENPRNREFAEKNRLSFVGQERLTWDFGDGKLEKNYC